MIVADPLERAMAHVEAHAFEPLSLDALADVAGLSPYHFARQFNARYGLTPMAFVRARRLGLAARRLQAGEADSLVELAFDAGFETQEGFTRAFKRAFGVSPGRYRAARAADQRRKGPIMSDAAAAPRLTMHPSPRREAGFRTAGLRERFDEGNKAGIPALWDRLNARLPIEGRSGARTFAVMWGADDGFHYQASVALEPGAPLPDGLEIKDVPEQTYLVFRHELDPADNIHAQMQAAVREIWGVRLPACGHKLARGPDLEVYPPDFNSTRAGAWVEWWIPIEA